jgi:Dienelactone hydrolase and related enzymes
MLNRNSLLIAVVPIVLNACLNRPAENASTASVSSAAPAVVSGDDASLPADAAHVAARLVASPRHGEWAMVRTAQGDSVKVWVVYPERRGRAPVVIVVHEIYGLSAWARGVADQLAAAGFIAIAPDLLTMTGAPRTADTVAVQDATAATRTLDAGVIRESSTPLRCTG